MCAAIGDFVRTYGGGWVILLLCTPAVWGQSADEEPFVNNLDAAYAVDADPEQTAALSATEDIPEEVRDDLGELEEEATRDEVRQFHQVLEDLLVEFGYDVKTGQLRKINNVAVRRVTVSDAIPGSYKKFLALLVSERIKKNASIRVVQCITCQVKSSTLLDGKMVITSPVTDLSVLQTMSERLGIEYFVDVMLVYHTTHMVLGFEVFKAKNQELVWARTYNSETVKSRYQRLAIDYSQIASARQEDEYQPEYRIMAGFGGGGIPNVSGGDLDSTMLAIQLRSTEKFDRRRTEFGMMLSLYVSMASILSEYPTVEGTGSTETTTEDTAQNSDFVVPAEPQPFTTAIGLFGLYSRNFLPTVESYDAVRQGMHYGVGAVLASGYIAPALKGGWDVFFGRSYVLSLSLTYMTPSKIFLGGETVDTQGGLGGVGVVSYNF